MKLCLDNTSKLLDYYFFYQLCYIAFSGFDCKVVTITPLDAMQIVLRALSSSPFKDYRVWWSLSDSKYAGTALFVKKKFEPKKVSYNLDRTCKYGYNFRLFFHNYILCYHHIHMLDA
jgi:hypothetical protein